MQWRNATMGCVQASLILGILNQRAHLRLKPLWDPVLGRDDLLNLSHAWDILARADEASAGL